MRESSAGDADLVVRGAIYTMDADRPWAEALAVRDGQVVAVGDEARILALAGPRTTVTSSGDGMVMPGIVDVHSHLGPGGQAAAWELSLPPASSPQAVLTAVTDWADTVGLDEWVVGGTLSGPVFRAAGTREMLAALDKASMGRPVMLRDDSLRNRWVNSRALEILGVDERSLDPAAGSYLRDAAGPVGLLFGQPSADAELAAKRSRADTRHRDLRSARTAVSIFNAAGITATQDAATTGAWLDVFRALDKAGQLNAWVVGSMPARAFTEPGPAGPALFDTAGARRSPHVRPDFVNAVLDGVPMTRTARLLEPYKPYPFAAYREPGGHHDVSRGSALFSDDELHELLEAAISRGLNVKLHAAGDGTVRQALDAIEAMRARYGYQPIFHIAHPGFVHPDDVDRFGELRVVADASPAQWFPGPVSSMTGQQVPGHYMDRIWPLEDLRDAGALIAAGSGWPLAAAVPDPWLSIETMVTRRGLDPAFPGVLAGGQALRLSAAILAHTVNAARAAGLGEQTGRLAPGLAADFIMLDRNLFTIPVDQIHGTRVRETWFAGRLVHESAAGN